MKELEHIGADSQSLPSTSKGSGTSTPNRMEEDDLTQMKTAVVEDEIDVILSHQSGLIERKKHPQLYVFFFTLQYSISKL